MTCLKILITLGLVAVCFTTIAVQVDRSAVVNAQARCGGIEGRVTTPQGWLIPDAKVFFFNKDTRKFSSARSNEQGLYEACLPA